MCDIENHMVVGLDKALDEYNREELIDEETGEPVPDCPFKGGQCVSCGKCDPPED